MCGPIWGFTDGTSGKEPTCQCRRCKRYRFSPWVRKIPWRRAGQPIPVFVPRTEEPGGRRSMKELDTAEVTHEDARGPIHTPSSQHRELLYHLFPLNMQPWARERISAGCVSTARMPSWLSLRVSLWTPFLYYYTFVLKWLTTCHVHSEGLWENGADSSHRGVCVCMCVCVCVCRMV